MVPALLILGLALGVGSWATQARGRIALGLLAAEGAMFLLVFTGG